MDESRSEDLHLDFKELRDPFKERETKKLLATALSGFANAEGGIVVWGIEAKHEVATRMASIKGLSVVKARLESLTPEAVSPMVDGIVHRAIDDGSGPDQGFVLTFVPESDAGPHMAKLGEDRYYKRNGCAFLRLEHFDLEDMFGRRPKPKLKLDRVVASRGSINGAYQFKVIVGIQNVGRGIAKFPRLLLVLNAPLSVSAYGIDGNGHHGLPEIRSGLPNRYRRLFGGGIDHVIHPGETLNVVAIISKDIRDSDHEVEDIQFRYEITAEGVTPVGGICIVQHNEIIKAISAPEELKARLLAGTGLGSSPIGTEEMPGNNDETLRQESLADKSAK